MQTSTWQTSAWRGHEQGPARPVRQCAGTLACCPHLSAQPAQHLPSPDKPASQRWTAWGCLVAVGSCARPASTWQEAQASAQRLAGSCPAAAACQEVWVSWAQPQDRLAPAAAGCLAARWEVKARGLPLAKDRSAPLLLPAERTDRRCCAVWQQVITGGAVVQICQSVPTHDSSARLLHEPCAQPA